MLERTWKNLILFLALSFGAEAFAGEGRYALTVKGALMEKDEQITLLSPAGSAITIPSATVRGKPVLIGIFHAGFSQGNDAPIDYHWTTVAEDLTYGFTTAAHYEDGPYDAVLIVYINTPISDDIINGDPLDAPPPVKGDLSSFTIDSSVVEGDDPGLTNGLVRLNVHGQDAEATVSNRPLTGTSTEEVMKALTNTVLIIP
jgi:hypothetical protein